MEEGGKNKAPELVLKHREHEGARQGWSPGSASGSAGIRALSKQLIQQLDGHQRELRKSCVNTQIFSSRSHSQHSFLLLKGLAAVWGAVTAGDVPRTNPKSGLGASMGSRGFSNQNDSTILNPLPCTGKKKIKRDVTRKLLWRGDRGGFNMASDTKSHPGTSCGAGTFDFSTRRVTTPKCSRAAAPQLQGDVNLLSTQFSYTKGLQPGECVLIF